MDSNKRRFLLTLWVVGLFSLTMIFAPSINGAPNIFSNSEFSIKTTGVFVEDFEDTTFRDVSTNAFGW